MLTENEITLIKENREYRITQENEIPAGLKLKVLGSNNKIIIGEQCLFVDTIINIANDKSTILIGDKCVLHNMFIDINSGDSQILEIGKNTTFFGGHIVLRDHSHIKIGENCLFANGLSMWATDGHTIFNSQTQQVINKTPEKLEIGNHCWIGGDVHILKNGSLADETVVGICSVVTKPFTEPHTVIGGYPAKVLKRGIDWSRDTIPNWLKRNI